MKKQKQQKPLVSVIMPVYNAGDFLVEAIESIVSQTYENWELIVVDDASTDNSWQIIKEYKERYPNKIKAVRLRKNRNAGGDVAGEIGFRMAKGELVARMDADDISTPDRLERQVRFLQKHKKVDIVGSVAWVINERGEILGKKLVPTTYEKIKEEFFVFHPLIHPTVMVRRSSFGKSFYKIDYPANNDYWTFFNYLFEGKIIANIKKPLLQYRIHNDNDSLKRIKKNFINSLKIRWEMVKKGYRPNLSNLIKVIGQSLIVFLLPERVVLEVYYLVKGIKDWRDYSDFIRERLIVRMRVYVKAMVAGIIINWR